MKIWTLRVSSCLMALAAAAAVGCSSQGCGGTNIDATPTGTQQSGKQCGQGTYLNSNYQCVPRPG